MDLEEFVKVEEQSPISSTDPEVKEEYFFAHFYNDDSEPNLTSKPSGLKVEIPIINQEDVKYIST